MHKLKKKQLNNRKAHNFCRVIQENQTVGGIEKLITTLKQGGYKKNFHKFKTNTGIFIIRRIGDKK